ncbi:hypothetical protein EDD22DRAFT_784685 [Suillus occidentalis]|nr:hypothetical protein EDD22DRAFT_784685 [Suillus occidentalis]
MFYPSIHIKNTEVASLQPLCIGICFPGTLPRHLLQGIIPIHISVSIAEEYKSFTTPVVEALALDGYPYSKCSSTLGDVSGQLSLGGHKISYDNIDIPIPFLPLPSNFSPVDSYHWLQLSQQIQRWLVFILAESQHWKWGCDVFWLAFVGACPDFPNGQWPRWDTRIPLKGQFIKQWLNAGTLGVDQSRESSLEQIWVEFCAHAILFHPDPLVSVN